MPLFAIIAAFALTLSLITKFFVDTYLHGQINIIGSFVALHLAHNSGVAFGMKFPPVFQTVLIFCALGCVCVLAWKAKRTVTSGIGYGLIVGGALGNVLDRLRDGLVTDFIRVGTFPIFNIADACITVGVVFLLAEILGIVRSH
jgi:signal peptidase II